MTLGGLRGCDLRMLIQLENGRKLLILTEFVVPKPMNEFIV